MTQKKKIIIISAVAGLGLISLVVGWLLTRPVSQPSSDAVRSSETRSADASRQQSASPTTQSPQVGQQTGYYGDYTDARAADRSYDKTILFFHAPWCSECRAFEQAIQAGPIPADVQILKVDYDSRQDLRQKYGVRIQSTFVELDDDDDQDNDHDVWVGYGKDKSINAILRNL